MLSAGEVLLLVIKMAAVIVLIFPVLWLVRRLVTPEAASPGRRMIHLLEQRPLADGQRLYLVRVAGKGLLVGATKTSVSVLAEVEGLPEPASNVHPEGLAAAVPWGGREMAAVLGWVRRCLGGLGVIRRAGGCERL